MYKDCPQKKTVKHSTRACVRSDMTTDWGWGDFNSDMTTDLSRGGGWGGGGGGGGGYSNSTIARYPVIGHEIESECTQCSLHSPESHFRSRSFGLLTSPANYSFGTVQGQRYFASTEPTLTIRDGLIHSHTAPDVGWSVALRPQKP